MKASILRTTLILVFTLVGLAGWALHDVPTAAAYAPECPGVIDGTDAYHHVPLEYATIQAAINAASPGDTVCVDDNAATYNENLTISTANITLLGAPGSDTVRGPGANAPVISPAAGRALQINANADGVTVRGFRISGGTSGIWGLGPLSDVVIRNNEVRNVDGPGIGLTSDVAGDVVNDNVIILNLVHNNDAQGIYIATSSGSCPTGDGSDTPLRNNIVANNDLYANICTTGCNSYSFNLQINCADGPNLIIDNDIRDITESGTDDFEAGVYLFNTTNNTFTCNAFTNNTGVGGDVWPVFAMVLWHPGTAPGPNNNLAYNSFTGNEVAYNQFTNNTIAENNWWGVSPPVTIGPNRIEGGVDYNPWLTAASQVNNGCQPPTLAKAFNPPNINVGDTAQLTFQITNNYAAASLSGIAFTDQLPGGGGITYTGVISNTCGGTLDTTGNGNTLLTFSGGSIAGLAGSTCTIVVRVQGNADGTYDNVTSNLFSYNSTGTSSSGADTLIVGPLGDDDDDDDDDDTGDDDTGGDVVVTDPGLSKTGVLGPGQLGLPGEQVTWTITATNPTGATLTNVVITDTFTPALSIDSVTTSAGSATINGQTVTVTIPALGAGQAATIQVVTTVEGSGGEFANTATLTADGGYSRTATATVNTISSLPATGYPPDEE
ncbi:MAG: DUF11 domain-containing protein [Chloroflexi bacterium]|nr:DUF11 domain-containing protein [Chloroflexota bacterium]